jgi:dipeptidyl-peptidase-2
MLCAATLQLREKVERLEKPVDNAENPIVYDQKQFWVDQILDHYDYKSTKTFRQRYYVIDSFFNPKVGPVFIYICGEYVCNGVPPARQWVVQLAQRLLGLVVILEHRYYGQSLPFGEDSLKVQNMQWLNS